MLAALGIMAVGLGLGLASFDLTLTGVSRFADAWAKRKGRHPVPPFDYNSRPRHPEPEGNYEGPDGNEIPYDEPTPIPEAEGPVFIVTNEEETHG